MVSTRVVLAMNLNVFTYPCAVNKTLAKNEVIATPTTTTTYTVTGTDTNGCVNTDDVTVIVNPLPIVDAGP